jgi:hypothetical protein
LCHKLRESEGNQRHDRLLVGDAKRYLIAVAALIAVILAAVAYTFRGSAMESARDFEECVEALGARQSGSPLNDERRVAMTGCSDSYYDFMQGRSFDIAGPNPTAEERKQIDREYIQFLDVQRREAAFADLAKTQNEQLRADWEATRQLVGPPLVLTPKNPPPIAAKRAADRSKPADCDDNPLACGWSKFSTLVKDAFASSSKAKPRT